jgi:toxin secretion/phage lysis holin
MKFQTIMAAAGGFAGWFLGGGDGFIYALSAFVIADYISGLMCAVVSGNLSSAVGAKGIFKKVMIFAVVGLAHLTDVALLGGEGTLRMAAIFFYISNEGISLLENAALLGVPVPPKVKNMLAQLKDKEIINNGDNENNPKPE